MKRKCNFVANYEVVQKPIVMVLIQKPIEKSDSSSKVLHLQLMTDVDFKRMPSKINPNYSVNTYERSRPFLRVLKFGFSVKASRTSSMFSTVFAVVGLPDFPLLTL